MNPIISNKNDFPLAGVWLTSCFCFLFDTGGDGILDRRIIPTKVYNPNQENCDLDDNNCRNACECKGGFIGNEDLGASNWDLSLKNLGRVYFNRFLPR